MLGLSDKARSLFSREPDDVGGNKADVVQMKSFSHEEEECDALSPGGLNYLGTLMNDDSSDSFEDNNASFRTCNEEQEHKQAVEEEASRAGSRVRFSLLPEPNDTGSNGDDAAEMSPLYDEASFRTCTEEQDHKQAVEEETPRVGSRVRFSFTPESNDMDSNQDDAAEMSPLYDNGEREEDSEDENNDPGFQAFLRLLLSRGPSDVNGSQAAATEMTPIDDPDQKEELEESTRRGDPSRVVSILSADEPFSVCPELQRKLEEEKDSSLPLDAFSMLFVAKWRRGHIMKSLMEHSIPFSVFVVQVLILILLLMNLLQESNHQLVTLFNVPVNVGSTVRVSQYIACMVAVFTADDLVTGVLHVGRQVVKKRHLQRQSQVMASTRHARATEQLRALQRSVSLARRLTGKNWKWEIANGMRIMEGALVIAVSFVFIVQSTTAIDLWLNFAGVNFVGILDDTAYHLAKYRVLGTTARRLAVRVTEYEVYQEGDRRKKVVRSVRLLLFVGMGVVLWAGLSFFAYNQNNFTYDCQSITVTVGESLHLTARHYSGKYMIQDFKIRGRSVYVQEQGNGAMLAYCDDTGINRWTISHLDRDETPKMKNPCVDFKLQSHRTTSYDITEIDGMQFWTGDDADADIKCNQCDVSHGNGDCSLQGLCNPTTKLCECEPGFFGDSCQFSGPCTEMVQHHEFHGIFDHGYRKSWDLASLDGRWVKVYDRPVYVQNIDMEIFDVIVFDGGRWFVSQSDHFDDWYNTYTREENAYDSLMNYLVTSFHALNSNYDSIYITVEASTLGSPSNMAFRAWLADAAEDNIGKLGEIEYEMACADCDNGSSSDGLSYCVNPYGSQDKSLCQSLQHEIHGNVNRCSCPAGFSGPQCQIRPIEGTTSLHLDHSTGTCSTCHEDNHWRVWNMDGVAVTCIDKGTLLFEDSNGTFSRQFGLHLNASHFSVFVSSSQEPLDTLCLAKEGTAEVYSVRRDKTDVAVSVAIHIDDRRDFFGEAVGPMEIGCIASSGIDHETCTSETNLAKVYFASDMKSSLKNAWLLLDLKVTISERFHESQKSESVSKETLPLSASQEEKDKPQPNEASTAPSLNNTSLTSDESSSIQPTDAIPTTSQEKEHSVQDHSIFFDHGLSNTASAASHEYTFAVIPKSTAIEFFRPVKNGCEERAETLSRVSVRGSVVVKCLFVGPAEADAQDQSKIAMDLINSGSVDGISMSVIDEAVAAEVIDRAVAANIPIITFDSDAPSSKRAAYVGTDNEGLGEELAILILSRFATEGNYAIVSAPSPNLVIRETAVRNILDQNNWNEVSGSPILVSDGQGQGVVGMMRDLMTRQPNIDAMILTFGSPLLVGDGQWESFAQQYPELITLSADSMPGQIDQLNRGYVNGLVGQQPAEMGSKSMDTLLALSRGVAVEEFIMTSMVVIGRVNGGTPYTQWSSAPTGTMGSAKCLLLMTLASLAFLSVLL